MLWLFNLWNLVQGRSVTEMGSFERRVAEGHALFYERAGFRYLGTYALSEARQAGLDAQGSEDDDDDPVGLPFSHAYVYLVDASSPKEAQDRIERKPLSAPTEAVALERRRFNDTTGARAQLWLQPILLSTAGKTAETLGLADGPIILLRLRGQEAVKGEEGRRRWWWRAEHRAASSRSSRVFETAGWQYLGAYRALGLQQYSRADLHTARASSPEEARLGALRMAQDSAELVAEYDARTGRAGAWWWLSPLFTPPRTPKR